MGYLLLSYLSPQLFFKIKTLAGLSYVFLNYSELSPYPKFLLIHYPKIKNRPIGYIYIHYTKQLNLKQRDILINIVKLKPHCHKKIGSGLIFCVSASVASIFIGKDDDVFEKNK